MKKTFIDIPLNITKDYCNELVSKVIELSKLFPVIKACILHGSYPGDLGVSDIDLIFIFDENFENQDLSKFYYSVKNISRLLDLMFFPSEVFNNIENYISLNNPNVIYIKENSIFEYNYNSNLDHYNIELITTLLGYLHKIRHVRRSVFNRNIKLRRNLLHFKSLMYSVNFLSSKTNLKKSLNNKFLQSELNYLRKNWRDYESKVYQIRFVNLQSIFISDTNKVLAKFDYLLRNKVYDLNKNIFFKSNTIGLLINYKYLPSIFDDLFRFIISDLLKLKYDPYVIVPKSIIDLLNIAMDSKKYLSEKYFHDLEFAKALNYHLEVAKKHKLILNSYQKMPLSLYGLGRII